MASIDRRIISPPTKLFWEGWESDTITLARHGWDFSAEQDYERMRYRLAMRNDRLGLVGVTDHHEYGYDPSDRNLVGRNSPPLDVAIYTDRMRFIDTPRVRVEAFDSIDVRPELMATSYEMRDLVPFRRVNVNAEQIHLEQASLSEILEIALSRQSGKQQEIRERMLRDKRLKDVMPESEVQAELRLVA